MFRTLRSVTLPDSRAPGDVRLECDEADAEVYIDGVFQGLAGDFDGMPVLLRLAPGLHHIEVRKPGRRPWRADVFPGDTRVVLRARLEPW